MITHLEMRPCRAGGAPRPTSQGPDTRMLGQRHAQRGQDVRTRGEGHALMKAEVWGYTRRLRGALPPALWPPGPGRGRSPWCKHPGWTAVTAQPNEEPCVRGCRVHPFNKSALIVQQIRAPCPSRATCLATSRRLLVRRPVSCLRRESRAGPRTDSSAWCSMVFQTPGEDRSRSPGPPAGKPDRRQGRGALPLPGEVGDMRHRCPRPPGGSTDGWTLHRRSHDLVR